MKFDVYFLHKFCFVSSLLEFLFILLLLYFSSILFWLSSFFIIVKLVSSLYDIFIGINFLHGHSFFSHDKV